MEERKTTGWCASRGKTKKIKVYPKVAKDFTEAGKAAQKYAVVVMGGTIPGITTDTDSVLLAEKLGAKRLVNISNVDAIYDSNPKTNPNAMKFDGMTYDELIALANSSDKEPPERILYLTCWHASLRQGQK